MGGPTPLVICMVFPAIFMMAFAVINLFVTPGKEEYEQLLWKMLGHSVGWILAMLILALVIK